MIIESEFYFISIIRQGIQMNDVLRVSACQMTISLWNFHTFFAANTSMSHKYVIWTFDHAEYR